MAGFYIQLSGFSVLVASNHRPELLSPTLLRPYQRINTSKDNTYSTFFHIEKYVYINVDILRIKQDI